MKRESEISPKQERDAFGAREQEKNIDTYFEKMVKEIRPIVEAQVIETIGKTDTAFSLREERLKDLIQQAGIHDVEALQELEEKTTKIKKKSRSLRATFKKILPYFIPLIFAGKLTRAEPDPEISSFDYRAVAADQLKDEGITEERKSAYTPGVSELLYRAITPVHYKSTWELISQSAIGLIKGREIIEIHKRYTKDFEVGYVVRKIDNPELEDAWRLYLGLPQENNAFGISEYQPSSSKNDQYYYRINHWFENFSQAFKETNGDVNHSVLEELVRLCSLDNQSVQQYNTLKQQFRESFRLKEDLNNTYGKFLEEYKRKNEIQEWTSESWNQWEKDPKTKEINMKLQKISRENDAIFNQMEKFNIPRSFSLSLGDGFIVVSDIKVQKNNFASFGSMGKFKISSGQDERGHYLSYYDLWNLEGSSVEGETGLLGKPFEIYDRIYYDPKTFEVI